MHRRVDAYPKVNSSFMQIHSDLTARAVVHHDTLPWLDSPIAGVARKMIERDGDEVARATSIVRYAPGSVFSQHTHGLGEEIVVLEGTFEDEYGRYGPGYYIKNPPGSAHAPSSTDGCTLLVKLRHMQPDDLERVVIDTHNATWHQGLVEGLKVLPLAAFATENTALVRWSPGTVFNPHRHYGGEEIFVLDGVFEDEFGRYPAGTWIRSPHMSMHKPFSVEGCTILVKTGHLVVAV
jgi:anti-sigma factor ChrR (cupin superfamily)